MNYGNIPGLFFVFLCFILSGLSLVAYSAMILKIRKDALKSLQKEGFLSLKDRVL